VLERAFKGQLLPQDPNDEAPQTMLERVRAEGAPVQHSKRLMTARRKEMTTATWESLKSAIERLPAHGFSFDDLRAIAPSEYESLKDMVFDLLADPASGLRQVFDEAAGEMRFRRTSA
jgi:type I restriction enzyme, S subunit